MSTSRDSLLSEGFQHIATRPVAIPHHVWKAEIDIEYDRRLRVVEEALLKLVGAGVSDPVLLQRLLGMQDEPIVPRYIAELMRNGLLAAVEDRLVVTTLGKRAVQEDLARERRTCSVDFRHDPYRDEFLWEFNEGIELKDKDLDPTGLVALPRPDGLSHTQVQLRLPELQKMVERDGLPFEDRKKSKGDRIRRPEVLSVRPDKAYVAYRTADLEIWHRDVGTQEWRWRLLMGGGVFGEATEKLQHMEADGQQVLPVEDLDRFKPGPKEEELQTALREVSQIATPAILDTADHRPALEQAIKDATRNLIIISPWIRPAAVDQEMLDWFRKGMERNKELRITIGYGIEDEEPDRRGQQTRKARGQEEAISRLHGVSQEFRGRLRLVKIGNTHEKIVVVDERYAIITSFNFLSFNPRPGKAVRRETGLRMTDETQVQALRSRLLKILDDGGPTAPRRTVAQR